MTSREGEKVIAQNESIVNRYLDDLRTYGRSSGTIYSYKTCLKPAIEFFKKPLKELKANDIKEYIDYIRSRKSRYGESIRGGSVRNIINRLNALLEYLEEEGKIKRNPAQRIVKRLTISYGGRRRRVLSVDEVRSLVRCAFNPRDRCVILLLYKTGCRVGELEALNVDDVMPEKGEIRILNTKNSRSGKKPETRIAFMDGETASYMQKYLRIRGLNPNAEGEKALFIAKARRLGVGMMGEIVRRAAIKAALMSAGDKGSPEKSVSCHCLRHSFTTHLLDSGARRDFVKELRGDLRAESIDIYVHITPQQLREEYLKRIPQLGI